MAKKKDNKLMKVEIREMVPGQLAPAKYNPRTISDDALAGLTNSLKRFGCVEPIIVNVRGGKNIIVGGHQRHKALLNIQKMNGQKDAAIQCVCVDLDEADEKLLNISLNNPQIQGEFIENIADYIENLKGDLKNEEDYINLRLAQLKGDIEFEEKTGRICDDDIPEPPKDVITKSGDLWILGEHRLLCGDSTKSEDVGRLMDGQKASLFATDPPYCIDYTGKDRPNGGKDWTDVYHEADIPDARAFIRDFYKAGLAVIKPNTALYLWHASRRRREIEDVCNEMGILMHQQIIWEKPCVIMTFSFYSWRHESCLLMWVKGHRQPYRFSDKKLGSVWPVGYIKSGDPMTPEYYTDVWQLDWDGKKRPVGFDHPTSKPVEIFAIPMRVHTLPGEICYEPFSGSGSQLIAAEKLGRRCYAMELEPYFVDVAVKRWEEWTGKKAERIQNG